MRRGWLDGTGRGVAEADLGVHLGGVGARTEGASEGLAGVVQPAGFHLAGWSVAAPSPAVSSLQVGYVVLRHPADSRGPVSTAHHCIDSDEIA